MADIGMIVTAVFGFFILKGLLGGITKGGPRQLISAGFTALSAVGAYYITSISTEKILADMSPEALAQTLASTGMDVGGFEAVIPYLGAWNLILQLPVAIFTAPVVFTVSFFALNTISKLFAGILCTCLGITKTKGNPAKALTGALIGLVEGFVIALIAFIPIVSMANIANNSFDVVREKNNGQHAEIIQVYDDYISPISKHPIIDLVNTCGGEKLLTHYATVDIDGEKTNLIDEATTAVSIGLEFASFRDADYSMPADQHKQVFYNAIDELDKSPYLSSLVSGILSGLGGAVDDGVIGVEIPSPYDEVLDPVITMFATSDRYNLHGDLETVLDVYFLLSDNGVLKAYGNAGGEEEVKAALIEKDENGKTLMSQVVEILETNERTKPLVTTLTKMTITVLAGQIGGEDFNSAETYDKIKTEFHDVLVVNPEDYETTEEYEDARDSAVNDALVNNGIELDDETVHEIGDYVDEHYGDRDDLTDEDINDILLYYYEISANNQDLEDLEGLE